MKNKEVIKVLIYKAYKNNRTSKETREALEAFLQEKNSQKQVLSFLKIKGVINEL